MDDRFWMTMVRSGISAWRARTQFSVNPSSIAFPGWVLPPTDFHTAPLVCDTIYLIGSFGYRHQRILGETAVFVHDTRTLGITRLETSGDSPGWIYRHRAVLTPAGRIRVLGGRIYHGDDAHSDNDAMFANDLAQ